MNSQKIDIVSRVEKLEKNNKSLRISNIILIILIGTIGLFAFQSKQEIPRIIEAEKFILKDPELGVLGYFGYNKFEDKKAEMVKTNVSLTMNGGVINIAKGSQNLLLESSRLIFSDKNTQNNKTIELLNSSEPYIELVSALKDGNSDIANLNPSQLYLYSKSDKKGFGGNLPKASLGKIENMNNSLNLFDSRGMLRAVIGSTIGKDDSGNNLVLPVSNIILFDSTGKVIYKQPK